MTQQKNQNDLIDDLLIDWRRERPDLDPSAMLVIGRILHMSKKLEKQASQALKGLNIYYTDLDVLATLRRSGSPFQLSPTELRKSVLITSGAMTALLNRLEKLELLERIQDPGDGRASHAKLTSKGIKIIDKAIEIRFKIAHDSLKGLKKREVNELAGMLKRVLVTLAEY